MKYGDMSLGQIEAVVNILGGMDGVKRLLRRQLVVVPQRREFHIWKTVTLGLHQSPDAYIEALREANVHRSNWADRLLDRLVPCKTKTTVDLVRVSPEDLGLIGDTTYEIICATALELGLRCCLPEVAPALRLQFMEQVSCDSVIVGSSAVVSSERDDPPGIFQVWWKHQGRSSDGPRLDACRVDDIGTFERSWPPLVFQLPPSHRVSPEVC